MNVKKLSNQIFSVVASIACAAGTASNALASNVISGVTLPGPATRATSTFVSKEPGFGAYPSYLVNTLNSGKFGTGVNLPAIYNGDGILPASIGNFSEFYIYYDVPNNGGPVASSGLNVVIQTSDGFSRIASPTATFVQSSNGYNIYNIYAPAPAFSPSFSPNQTILRTASVRYNGSIGQIYLFFPIVIGANGQYLSNTDFSFKTTPDSRFNNQ